MELDVPGTHLSSIFDITHRQNRAHANGEVNVDLDHLNEVVGIELLAAERDELAALAKIAQEHDLRFDLLFPGRRSGAEPRNSGRAEALFLG